MVSLIDRLGLTVPIVQAPMAGVSSPAMAAAVSNAGGLGSISIGASDAAAARAQLQELRAATSRAINVNLFCHAHPARDEEAEARWIDHLRPVFARFGVEPSAGLREIYLPFEADPLTLELLLEVRPEVVSVHFGLPSASAIGALKARGILLIGTATNPTEAQAIEEAGLDAIVAQGWEAGGHRGMFDPDQQDPKLGTMALVRLLACSSRLPVIAAGGIMDGAGIAAALRLGAEAAQLGTAFIGCPESLAEDPHKAMLGAEPGRSTRMVATVSGRPARCLANGFTALQDQLGSLRIPAYPLAYDLGKALHRAATARGNHEFGAYWAGQGAPLARSLPASKLVEQLAAELAAARGSREP